ncbi:MAG: signal peptidase I [Nanoarchaeota archaeon]|nr:signal peptidase I [Nanoarchaeota archaeon]
MIKKILGILLLCSFIVFALALYIDTTNDPQLEVPINSLIEQVLTGEQASPGDRIKEDQIKVYEDRVVIQIANAKWAGFTDTNSMDPLLDEESNAIQVIPESADEIQVGDIITYESSLFDGMVIHRVILIGEDEEGTYFIAKGDNNPDPDPEKIRFNQIRRILVGILY